MYLKLNPTTVLVVFPKVASQSIQFAAFANGAVQITAVEALALPRRIIFLRQPLKRLVSAFSFLMQLTKEGTVYDTIMPAHILGTGIPGECKPLQEAWEAFINYILSQDVRDSDDHWKPQIELATYTNPNTHEKIFVPNHTYKFEELNARWGTDSIGRLPGTLEHMNAVTKLEPQEFRKAHILQYYSKDITAYGKL